MAPELFQPNDIEYSEKVDVWAIGVLVYESLVGVSPFYHNNEKKIIESIVHADYIIPLTLQSDVVSFLEMTLRPQPEDRASIKDLLLHPFLTEAPVFTLRRSQSEH
jgi:serine/threonine protein kinase